MIEIERTDQDLFKDWRYLIFKCPKDWDYIKSEGFDFIRFVEIFENKVWSLSGELKYIRSLEVLPFRNGQLRGYLINGRIVVHCKQAMVDKNRPLGFLIKLLRLKKLGVSSVKYKYSDIFLKILFYVPDYNRDIHDNLFKKLVEEFGASFVEVTEDLESIVWG